MTKRILIIGGYGNFGSYIAKVLAKEPGLQLLIGGRSLEDARQFVSTLPTDAMHEAITLDITGDIGPALAQAKPDIVVHTTGPFQKQGYGVAETCIAQGCHYIDLADARAFVCGIEKFDEQAKQKNILVVSGASSVPCLTAAVIDHYRPDFSSLEKIEYGITATQQTNRGPATTTAVLSYVGKPFTTLAAGKTATVYGWQDLHAQKYPELGYRLFGNCDIPDLDLFPARYAGLKTVRFSAGHEIPLMHLGLWLLSWFVRAGIMPSLDRIGNALLKTSFLFDRLSTGRSGFHMLLSGTGKNGVPLTKKFFIIARSGHGPYIPCMPAILLAKGLASGTFKAIGARPCLDLIGLEAYLDALKGLDISIFRDGVND